MMLSYKSGSRVPQSLSSGDYAITSLTLPVISEEELERWLMKQNKSLDSQSIASPHTIDRQSKGSAAAPAAVLV